MPQGVVVPYRKGGNNNNNGEGFVRMGLGERRRGCDWDVRSINKLMMEEEIKKRKT